MGIPRWDSGLFLTQNLTSSLRRLGITFGFRFLGNSANFGITEGIPYDPSESYLKAFVVGVVNTLWLSSISIVLATVMGMILGVARLSSNWLARQLATIITEIFRNIPVLLIVIFWYQGVILTLPAVRNSYSIGGFFFISQRGINLPSLDPSGWLLPTVIILAGAARGIRKLLLARRPDVGPIQRNSLVGLGVLLLAVACWILFPESPLRVDIPVLDRFNFRGGTQLSAEFTAMMLGLVTYTGCYIAEVVRGSFLAVQRGQWEASRAIGLTELATFQLVIVPQALWFRNLHGVGSSLAFGAISGVAGRLCRGNLGSCCHQSRTGILATSLDLDLGFGAASLFGVVVGQSFPQLARGAGRAAVGFAADFDAGGSGLDHRFSHRGTAGFGTCQSRAAGG